MYRIYCNAVALHLIEKSTWEKWMAEYPNNDAQQEIIWDESLEWDSLFEEWFAENNPKDVLIVLPDDTRSLKEVFPTCVWVPAAGGAVRNRHGEWLMIFRRNHWDLPKGMIEKQEDPAAAACREVEEETGVTALSVKRSILLYDHQQPCTFHLYPIKGKWALKPTYWYLMEAEGTPDLHPQIEEEIEKAAWVHPSEIVPYLSNAYPNIADVMYTALRLLP